MCTAPDRAYQEALRGKKYMMGVSPWFYTRKYDIGGLQRALSFLISGGSD